MAASNKSILLWVLAQCVVVSLWGRPDTLELSCMVNGESWRPFMEVYVDESGRMGLEEAREVEGYLPADQVQEPLPLGQRLWVRTWVVNRCSRQLDVLLTLSQSDSTVVYLLGEGEVQMAQVGEYVASSLGNLPLGWKFGVRLSLEPDEVKRLYILKWEKVGTGPELDPEGHPYWETVVYTFEEYLPSIVTLAIFTGVLLISIVYNLIVAASLRSASYLYYSLYLMSILLIAYFVVADSFIPAISSLRSVWVEVMKSLGLNVAALFYLLFGRSFVNSAELTPGWDRWLKGLIGIRLALVLSSIGLGLAFPKLLTYSFAINIWLLVEAVFILFYLAKLIRLRRRVLWFFIIGSALVFVCGFGPVVVGFFVGGFGNDGPVLMTVLGLEILVFSLGLGYKVRQQQQEKLAAEQALNQELQKVNSAFGRFVPHAFIESLGHRSVLDIQLGDQVEKEVTVLFSDIRGYTTLAEGMTPQENFDFLNAYLGRMGPIIQGHQGFVNQYYGDGIMALFLQQPADAVEAAIAMQQELARYNEKRVQQGRIPLRIGIGIHTGPLMMGIIGDTLRLEAGVVSDTVNTAARMEGLTKHFGVNVLLSESTWAHLTSEQQGRMRSLGRVMVKGRQQATEVYQAFGGETSDYQHLWAQHGHSFAQALEAYLQRDFGQAIAQFEVMASALPQDQPTQLYLQLSRQYLVEGVPEDWDGTERMLVK